MKNILVTGGYGFIGSNFIRGLYKAYPDYCIYNLDFLTYAGNTDNLIDIEERELMNNIFNRRYHFIYGDIADSRLLDIIFSRHQFDMVVNFAAETHVDRSIINMRDFVHTNIGGVRSLIEAVREYGVRRFVHISTDEVYGDVESGYSTEDGPIRPSNPYSSSKAAADLIVQSFIRTHQVPALIVRGSNNYGAFQYPEKLIPLAISNMVEGKKIPVHGTGQHVRSWVHVLDFSRAIDFLSHHAPDFEVYNVLGQEKTNLEILEMIANHVDVDVEQYKKHVADRPGADKRYAVDGTKLKKLGWESSYSLETDLGDVVKWYLSHRSWWEKIKTRKEYVDHYNKQSKGRWY